MILNLLIQPAGGDAAGGQPGGCDGAQVPPGGPHGAERAAPLAARQAGLPVGAQQVRKMG